jgi:hypothetical protein
VTPLGDEAATARQAFAEIIASMTRDPDFRAAFTAQLEARTVDADTIDRLIAYARDRQVSSGHAIARKVLTEAGISWEAL